MEGFSALNIKREDDDDDVIFLQEVQPTKSTKQLQTEPVPQEVDTEEQVPSPQQTGPSVVTNDLPKRYLHIFKGKAKFSDSVLSGEVESSSESSDDEEAVSFSGKKKSSSFFVEESSEDESSYSEDEEFTSSSASDSGTESPKNGKKGSTTKYRKPVRKVVKRSVAQKKKIHSALQTVKEKFRKKKSKETEDVKTEKTPRLPSGSISLYNDVFGSNGETSGEEPTLSSNVTETEKKYRIPKKRFRRPKAQHDSDLDSPTDKESSENAPSTVSKNCYKRRNGKVSEKIHNQPKQIHPESAPPGKGWQEKLSNYGPKTMPKQPDEKTRKLFVSSLKESLENRLQQSKEPWAVYKVDIEDKCKAIETEAWNSYKNALSRYKEQFRALKRNISDGTNPDFWRKILMGTVSNKEAANMSSIDMASQAKKQQREKATKLDTDGYVRNAIEYQEREKELRSIRKNRHGEIVEKKPDANDSQNFRLLEDFKKDTLSALPSNEPISPPVHSSPSTSSSTSLPSSSPVELPIKKSKTDSKPPSHLPSGLFPHLPQLPLQPVAPSPDKSKSIVQLEYNLRHVWKSVKN